MVGLWACLAFAFRGPAGGAVRPPLAVVLLPTERFAWGRCVVMVLAAARGSVVFGLVSGRDGVGDAVVRIGDRGRDGLPVVGLSRRRAVSLVDVVGGVAGGRVDARVP